MTEPKQVHIYIRVSSNSQNLSEFGRVGMDTQNMAVLDFCIKNNLYIKSCITEIGSAYHTHTPELIKLIKKLEPGIPIMVYSINRFSRNVKHANEMLNVIHSKGSYIWSVSEQMTSKDYAFEFLVKAAENYSRQLGKTISDAHKRIRAQGGFIGKKPFGYNKIRDNGVFKLQENCIEQKIMKKIQELAKIKSKNDVLLFAMKKYPRYNWTSYMIDACIYDTIRNQFNVIEATGPDSGMNEMMEAINEIDEEENSKNIYIINRFHKIRLFRDNYEILVEWKGFSKCTWENIVTIYEDVGELVKEFLNKSTSKLIPMVRQLLNIPVSPVTPINNKKFDIFCAPRKPKKPRYEEEEEEEEEEFF
jgi:DNA invertase Pin-like site-specific DNA recombinase